MPESESKSPVDRVPAHAFDRSLAGGKTEGMLLVEEDGLRFIGSGVEYRLPYDRLGCRLGGVFKRTLCFSHRDLVGLEIATPEVSLVERPTLAGLHPVQTALVRGWGYDRRFWSCMTAGCFALTFGGAVLAMVVVAATMWIVGLR